MVTAITILIMLNLALVGAIIFCIYLLHLRKEEFEKWHIPVEPVEFERVYGEVWEED